MMTIATADQEIGYAAEAASSPVVREASSPVARRSR
jgi:hypothetical protein